MNTRKIINKRLLVGGQELDGKNFSFFLSISFSPDHYLPLYYLFMFLISNFYLFSIFSFAPAFIPIIRLLIRYKLFPSNYFYLFIFFFMIRMIGKIKYFLLTKLTEARPTKSTINYIWVDYYVHANVRPNSVLDNSNRKSLQVLRFEGKTPRHQD